MYSFGNDNSLEPLLTRQTGVDGTIIDHDARLMSIIESFTATMKQCAMDCDTYQNKHVIGGLHSHHECNV